VVANDQDMELRSIRADEPEKQPMDTVSPTGSQPEVEVKPSRCECHVLDKCHFIERLFPFLSREATVAGPGFNRWFVPPAAVICHMSIGQAYAWSVFNKPLSIELKTTVSQVTIAYQLALAMLGLSAALFGSWVERSGPRKTMVASWIMFCGGLLLSAIGVRVKALALVIIAYGLIGGVGLGVGYIAAVSTLVKWFPDRPGMATGMAIMGFGGGALFASPLSQDMMVSFASPDSKTGATYALIGLAIIYSFFILFGAAIIRVPPPDWAPKGYKPAAPVIVQATTSKHFLSCLWVDRTTHHITLATSMKTIQFWLLWVMLLLNVSAGIGILGRAADMCQDMFGVTAAAGAGFVGLLSLFNMGGRFLWSSASDYYGRKMAYIIYFILGICLFVALPSFQVSQNRAGFVACCCIIISMYGAGFATIPAYLKDLFGTYQVGAIHGRLITAWSVAALVGPSIVNGMFDYYSTVSRATAYNLTFYLMAGLLFIGLLASVLVRPANPKHHMTTPIPKAKPPPDALLNGANGETEEAVENSVAPGKLQLVLLVITWCLVATPLVWAIIRTIQKCIPLFG
jgi:MFS family permease